MFLGLEAFLPNVLILVVLSCFIVIISYAEHKGLGKRMRYWIWKSGHCGPGSIPIPDCIPAALT